MTRVINPWPKEFTKVDLDLTGIESPEVGRVYDETSHPKIGWHTTEGKSLAGARSAFAKYPPHIGVCFEDLQREIYLPLDRCSFSFRGNENDDEFVIQVEVAGFAKESHLWSNEKLDWLGSEVLAVISRATGCPTTIAPQGFHGADEGLRLAYTDSPIRFTDAEFRAFSGQCGHQHAPSPDVHWDPGRLNVARIKQAADKALGVKPTPKFNPVEDDMFTFGATGKATFYVCGSVKTGIHNQVQLKSIQDAYKRANPGRELMHIACDEQLWGSFFANYPGK